GEGDQDREDRRRPDGLLKRPLTPRENFPAELAEKNFIQGWRDHGSHRYRYAFDNPSVRGYPALSQSEDEVLRQTKGLACLQRQVDEMEDPPNMLQLARHILRDPQLYEYSSYTLEALMQRAGAQVRGQIAAEMRASQGFMRYLERAQQADGYRGRDAKRLYAQLKPSQPKAKAETKTEPAEQAKVE
ncbi:MAG: hypothetical protein R3352_10310, partial [Salinisphaeraceae bacterium]|nr:hypothetical protein [Salinisphaeraceae bacterium]